jgi:hypothetical protein
MSAPMGRILLPDRVSLEELTSLAKIRCQFRTPKAQSHLERLRQELLPAAPAAVTACLDSFTACVLSLAAKGNIALYVASTSEGWCYQIDPTAKQEAHPGFLVRETVEEAYFIIAPGLMACSSIEIRLDGQPIFAEEDEVDRAIRPRPTSSDQLEKIIKEAVDKAIAQGNKVSNSDLVDRVMEHDAFWGVSKTQIRKKARKIKPPEWSKPGPKRAKRYP